ncbi:MAG TPA: flagellar hook-associated protein FlgL [Acidobacteriaceae bacterium]|jgi:flagellar hook-associated protein 3 FlgL|nr:flagellar hook-associated protein FlgL [Acidobacteriaceae bacterium]
MNVNSNYLQQLTAALSHNTAQQQAISSEISSGVRLSGLGDDPIAASQNVQFSSQIAADSKFTQTASTTTAMMQVADSTLGSVVDQINQAISVATSGNNGTNNASDRSSVAAELTSIRDEILGLANTSYSGKYLFSGSQNNNPPFQLDTSTTPATVTYSGDNVVNHVSTPGGQSIATNLPGQQVFTAAGGDLLGTLNALIQDFSSGNTATTISLTSQLGAALSQVSTQRASLDGAINRFQSASSYASQERTQLVANQTNLLQADLPTVATELSSNQTQQAALESVIVTIEKQGTLFDRM